jgi:four helix bundle protein
MACVLRFYNINDYGSTIKLATRNSQLVTRNPQIMAKSYLELEVYKLSFDLFIETHQFSFKMPKHEMYELGSQLRRSADSVNSNIVEGYGRRVYKNDFIKFLIYSHASNDETINHLRKIKHLYPNLIESDNLIERYDILGRRLNAFIDYVRKNWK